MSSSSSTTNSSSSSSMNQQRIAQRAQQLRIKAQIFTVARKVFVPAVALYSLFLLRPREGHFIRHIAEKRYFDREFNALFPSPVDAVSGGSPSSALPAADTKPQQPKDGWFSFLNRSDEGARRAEASSASERDLRRRLMFRRTETADGTNRDGITTMTVDELKAELQGSDGGRASMNTLANQLDDMSLAKKQGKILAGVPPETLPNYPVEIEFTENWLSSSATIRFFDGKDRSIVKAIKSYIGVCGMLWVEL